MDKRGTPKKELRIETVERWLNPQRNSGSYWFQVPLMLRRQLSVALMNQSLRNVVLSSLDKLGSSKAPGRSNRQCHHSPRLRRKKREDLKQEGVEKTRRSGRRSGLRSSDRLVETDRPEEESWEDSSKSKSLQEEIRKESKEIINPKSLKKVLKKPFKVLLDLPRCGKVLY